MTVRRVGWWRAFSCAISWPLYAAPVLEAKPVAEIDMRDVLRVLQPIWSDKTENWGRPSCG